MRPTIPTATAAEGGGGRCRTGHTPSPPLAAIVHHVPMTVEIPEHLFVCIDHVGIAVPDLDEAVKFYAEALGMRMQHEEVNEEQGVREAMIAVGDSGSCIQLLAPLNEQSTIAKFLHRHRHAIQQLAYRGTDLEAVPALHRERGLRALHDVANGGTAGSLVHF